MSSGVNFQSLPNDYEIKRHIHPSLWQELREYVIYFFKVFASVAIIYLFLRTSVFDAIGVSGESMFPTYHNKDQIYIDQLTPKFGDYQRGDVVVFLSPKQFDGKRELFIKRIIGKPGEKIIIQNGKVSIQSDEFPEPVEIDEKSYLGPTVYTYKKIISGSEKYEEEKLGPNEYFVMGDNRTGSTDSRAFGKITKQDILGKEFYRIFPPEKSGFYKLPKYNISN